MPSASLLLKPENVLNYVKQSQVPCISSSDSPQIGQNKQNFLRIRPALLLLEPETKYSHCLLPPRPLLELGEGQEQVTLAQSFPIILVLPLFFSLI